MNSKVEEFSKVASSAVRSSSLFLPMSIEVRSPSTAGSYFSGFLRRSSYSISGLPPNNPSNNPTSFFGSGSLAICPTNSENVGNLGDCGGINFGELIGAKEGSKLALKAFQSYVVIINQDLLLVFRDVPSADSSYESTKIDLWPIPFHQLPIHYHQIARE